MKKDNANFANLFLDLYIKSKIYPNKTAIIKDNQEISYSSLVENVLNVAANLKDIGLVAGDRVILFSSKCFEFIYLYYAAKLLGLIVAPLDPDLPTAKLGELTKEADARLIVNFLDKKINNLLFKESNYQLDEMLEIAEKNDIEHFSELVFTSGTTGKPKGVLLTNIILEQAVRNINSVIKITDKDKELLVMPLNHSFALARMRCIFAAGGTIVLIDGLKSPKKFFRALKEKKITSIGMVPAAWNLLWKISSEYISKFAKQIKFIEIGSAPMSKKEKIYIAKLLPHSQIFMHYGLTEASRSLFNKIDLNNNNLDSLGKPPEGTIVKVLDIKGKELSKNEIGEICIKGDHVAQYFFRKGQVIKNNKFHGKYLRTSDMGFVDNEGNINLYSRFDEIINVGGKKVSPIEVEGYLNEHEQVDESACFGVEDSDLGSKVIALIKQNSTQKTLKINTLDEYLKTKCENYKIPKEYIFTNEIPKTKTGKIMRTVIKEMYNNKTYV